MTTAIHWFRRDFRVRDNTALHAAAAEHDAVVGVFVLDPRWFGPAMGTIGPHQAAYWLDSVRELVASLLPLNIPLAFRTSADPVATVLRIAQHELGAETITYNKEYEPAQIAQDMRLERLGTAAGLKVRAYKDAAVFEEQEILTGAGTIYSVFSPYQRAFLKRLAESPPEIRGLPRKMKSRVQVRHDGTPAAEDLGFAPVTLHPKPGEAAAAKLLRSFRDAGLKHYHRQRDFPAVAGTSRWSAALNAGTMSIRQAMTAARSARDGTFLSELIWREFYRMVLFHHPHTIAAPFQERTHRITWRNDPALFAAWAEARTGYPIVDAALRQLLTTGWMHNRLRMIAAMFLTKDLDTHWTRGERFFMCTLIDYDQASNVGGWQWSASTGTDAAPYFRVMNPVLQGQRFDPQGAFVKSMLPALAKVPAKYVHAPWTMPPSVQREAQCRIGVDYPAPIVDHAAAKVRAIAKFRTAKGR